MRTFTLFAVIIAGNMLCPRALPQDLSQLPEKNAVTKHPGRQKDCEKRFILLMDAREFHEDTPVYQQMKMLVPLFGLKETPHLYETFGNGSAQYITGSRYDPDGKGIIFLPETIFDEMGNDPDSSPLEGQLGDLLAYLKADKGLQTCKNYDHPDSERDAEIDVAAAEVITRGPIVAFLNKLKSILSAHRGDSPEITGPINMRLTRVNQVEMPPAPPDAPTNPQ